ncbi:Hypothetical predicted protein [Lecanosticta acicola]|uniref:Uncharacterized protein n=1 Tax=Lecanosticta acicola TaxID=111012 RepID=A0AAI9EDY7_9PEZI|nr:Hypothetical predicted protein [Lecanosticta acicola]
MAANRLTPNGYYWCLYQVSVNVVQLSKTLVRELARLSASLSRYDQGGGNGYRKDHHLHLQERHSLLEALESRANDHELVCDLLRTNAGLQCKIVDLGEDLADVTRRVDSLAPNHTFSRDSGPYDPRPTPPPSDPVEVTSDTEDKPPIGRYNLFFGHSRAVQKPRQPPDEVPEAVHNVLSNDRPWTSASKRKADHLIVSSSGAVNTDT